MAQYGIYNYKVVGDPRIDRVISNAAEVAPIPIIRQFKASRKLLIIGSPHAKDLTIFFEALSVIKTKDYHQHWCFLIAPHEIEESNIQQIEIWSSAPTYRFSQLTNPIDFNKNGILLLNTIGLLSQAYQYADAAFIGGGFGKSIHNILEPAAFGVPIIFGPNYHQFPEAVDLVTQKGAFSIQSAKEILTWFEALQVSEYSNQLGSVCKNYIWQNKGATQKIISYFN